jgi:thioester reductase-like protein
MNYSEQKPRTIIVLGSTGFLGPFLVEALLSANQNASIICVNRSADGQERTLRSLQEITRATASHRLRFIVADIAKPRYGLDIEFLVRVMTDVEEVVFNAWNPNWALPVSSFESLLNAVQHTIHICLSIRKPPRILFISSICAVAEWPRNHTDRKVIPEAITMDHRDAARHGYGESKNMAEVLLANACATSNIPVAIIRTGQIGGPSSPDIGSWPVQGWILAIIKASQRTGFWPSHVIPLDWIPVDTLAGAIGSVVSIQHGNDGENDKTRQLQVYNMVHPHPAPWNLLFATLKERFGFAATEVGLMEWLDLFDPDSFKLYNFLREMEHGREYDLSFDTENASKFLPTLSIISMHQLADWLKGWSLDKQRYIGPASKL